MKKYNEVQEQIEGLEAMQLQLEKQIHEAGHYSPLGSNTMLLVFAIENNIKILKWVLS